MEETNKSIPENIYIYPKSAKQKLKIAQEMNRTVYLYGACGYGKTVLLEHYLSRRQYCYLDAAVDTVEQFQEKPEAHNIVVVDNLQAAEPEDIREAILKLTERRSIWLILCGRCQCPSWLVAASVSRYPFMVIEEEDLRLTTGSVDKYLNFYDIHMEREDVDRIKNDSQGHPLILKLVVTQMLRQGKDAKRKTYVYSDEIFRRSQQMFWDYLEHRVYDQWEPGFTEFIQQLCVVDRFDVRMAETISGRRNVEALLQKALETGNFMREQNGEYTFITPLLRSMRRRLRVRYSKEQINKLYYKAGLCYNQQGRTMDALAMFEACGDQMQISSILIENARMNPGNGYLFELRKYYLELPEEYISDSVELTAGMCMLQSLLLNIRESERWYEVLKCKAAESVGRARMTAKSWLAYLDIGLPHRSNDNMLSLLKSAGILLRNREIVLPEFSVTNNSPSMMNGGKDFCEWSKRDKEFVSHFGKLISFVLGKRGAGFVELALAESTFEKGGDNYEVVRLVSKGQIQAENRGKIEQEFVAAGLLANVHIMTGHADDARILLTEFGEKAKRQKADKIFVHIQNLFCRISMYKGERTPIDEWMKDAPGNMEDFNPMEREYYLTKIRIYLLYGKYELAESLLEKMFYYADVMNRAYIHMECELLLAILQYRRGSDAWTETFRKAVEHAAEYHFVRVISKEGCAVLPLLQEWKGKTVDAEFMEQVMAETKCMAEYYPAYLRGKEDGEEEFSENAVHILRMQAEGLVYKQIAEELGVTVATVKYHCSQTYKKLGVKGKAAAVMEARRRGIL